MMLRNVYIFLLIATSGAIEDPDAGEISSNSVTSVVMTWHTTCN